MQLSVWQFLPLGPTAYGDSPYQPLSSFAGNEMLIDIGDLVEIGLLDNDEAQQLASLPSDFVDYGRLIPIKSQLLRVAADRFEAHATSDLKTKRDDFVAAHDQRWLHDYARYRVLKAQHDERPWPEWEPPFADRSPNALSEFEGRANKDVSAVKILQFLFFEQWQRLRDYANERGVSLFGDMPIYVALDSADAWAERELLLIDDNGMPSLVAGVPPDYFSEHGQLWGNPIYDWQRHAETGYRWWTDRLRAAASMADIVRIDHFRGFEAYWAVPAESDVASSGSWQPGPRYDLFDTLKENLGELPIVAEDLGVITPEVDALRDRYDFPGMVVLQFAIMDDGFSLDAVPANRVCYTGTHDNDTTLGWFRGSPDDMRSPDEIANAQRIALAITGGTPESISSDMIAAAFSTQARLAIAPLQDYLGLGSEARINVPGTSADNWRWRVTGDQLNVEIRQKVAGMVEAAGRSPQN